MRTALLGLDIGGANLKAADNLGQACSVPFALWRHPELLESRLRLLLKPWPEAPLAATMTGESCDCFADRRQGVKFILDAVARVAQGRPVAVWSHLGRFLSLDEAGRQPAQVASANWLATATWCSRFLLEGRPGLLIDIGSTTTDIIPLAEAGPIPRGRTDLERLGCDELVYRGIVRTPVAALAEFVSLRGRRVGLAAELFATTRDVYLLLGRLPEQPDCTDTADGKPATVAAARVRLARMVGADADELTPSEIRGLAEQLDLALRSQIRNAVWRVRAHSLPGEELTCVAAGSGEFLARQVIEDAALRPRQVFALGDKVGPEVSQAVCAHAVAVLAERQGVFR
jgi:probable H4MPT-linked C1 transfer pathway protein